MRVRIDQKSDALYLFLADRPVMESAEVADGIIVDYDADGHMVGIELLDASKKSNDATVLKTFSFESPRVAE